MIAAPKKTTERHLLAVPGLSAQAAIGSCCGAVAAAEAIQTSLLGWRGVESVQVEGEHDRVVVVADREAGLRMDDLLWSLRMLGLEQVREAAPPEPNVSPF